MKTYTPEQKQRGADYKAMVSRKKKHGFLPKANESKYALGYINNHLPPAYREKDIHHIGVSMDETKLIIIFADGTQTNLEI